MEQDDKFQFVELNSHTTFAYFYLNSATFGYPLARRSKLCIACSDFFKSQSALTPLFSAPNYSRCAGLRFGFGTDLKVRVSILLRYCETPQSQKGGCS